LLGVVRMNLKVEHYQAFTEVFVRALMTAMGSQFTEDLKDAWLWFFAMIAKVIFFMFVCLLVPIWMVLW
jgi:hemoglobin-like flavoprotein